MFVQSIKLFYNFLRFTNGKFKAKINPIKQLLLNFYKVITND